MTQEIYDIQAEPKKVERAFLVGLQHPDEEETIIHEHLNELEALSDTLKIPVVGRFVAKLRKPQSRYLVGTGKAEEIVEEARMLDADSIVFDDSLSPSQQRNWEKLSKICVIDRQEVILDIFGERAQTREAVLQVALARAQYSLPRLKRMWTHLHRQRGAAGGHGMRGEGEQQLEVDSRLVRKRISRLQEQLKEVRKQREVQRKRRLKKPVPMGAIVGYTNAGKSTLLNFLTEAKVFAEDKLFATLDPTIRRITLPNNQDLLLADTVGFIRKLPHQLVEAFKATLEEAADADFLVEVLDINSQHLDDHHETTIKVLSEIGVHNKPVITVFNKVDMIEDPFLIRRIKRKHPNAVFISAAKGTGAEELVEQLAAQLNRGLKKISVKIPHDRHDLIALLHRTSNILFEKYDSDGARITAAVPSKVFKQLKKFENNFQENIDAVEIPC